MQEKIDWLQRKISSLSRIRGYAKILARVLSRRVSMGERGGVDEERVLRIKAHPSSRVCDLYESCKCLCKSGILQHRRK